MSTIGVIDSEKRRIDIETFKERLEDVSVDRIALEKGSIDAPIDPGYDLSSYRALYLRVGAITESVLDRADNLEIVSTCGSGYDHIDVEAATERNVLVTHTPNAPAPGAVEHTFGFILTLLNDFPNMFDRTASGKWGEGQTVVNEIRNRTIGVVGVGTIGSQVAEIAASSFGADVVAYDPYVTGEKVSEIYPRVTQDEMEKKGVAFLAKDELFEASSLVTMHVPLTDDTHAMVGKKELEALNGGYFINLSRGGVVDEEALHYAVSNNILKAAALDVMRSEPPRPSNPLLQSDNVYITPHIAGGKEGYKERSAKINARGMNSFFSGELPNHVVNPVVYRKNKN